MELIIHFWKDAIYIDLWSFDHACEFVVMNSQFHWNSSMQPFVQFHYHSQPNQILEMGQNTEKAWKSRIGTYTKWE